MPSSSESDPFTTTEAHSPSRSQTLIHGFPKQRLSFRNVDRVRERIGSRGAGESERRKTSIGGNVVNNRKRKLGDVDANANASKSAPTAVSVTSASASAATSWKKHISVTASNKSHQEKTKKETLGRRVAEAETSNTSSAGAPTSAYTLKTAERMQTSSVGRTAPSSPTGKDPSKVTAHARAEDAKLRRRRTFAGYVTRQHKSELPHIDLISKLARSSSASPAATHLRRHSAPSQDHDGTSMSRSVVLHKSSLSRKSKEKESRRQSRDLGYHARRLSASHSTAFPGSSTSLLDNNGGISINQLSARSLELLIENGLALVFKKMEMNHGFANEIVKRAWIRCNGDIEATDHLLLTMRKAAEKAEASFLETGPRYPVDEYDESTSEEEEEEEEERRPSKRPRMWNESRALTAAAALPPSSDSIESHYAPRFSSDREELHPVADMEDYTPPVGTKAEAYRRLSEQGRSEEAQKVLVAKVLSQGRTATTPRKNAPKGKEIVASRLSGASLDGTDIGTGSGQKQLRTDEDSRTHSSAKKTVQRVERIPSLLGHQTTARPGQLPSSSLPRMREIPVPGDKTDAGKDRVEETVITSPSETVPTISKPIKTSSESRSSSAPEREERPKATTTATITPYARHDNHQHSPTEIRTRNDREGEGEREKRNSSTSHDLGQQWSLSDEEVLRKSPDLSQLEKLSAKYGEREVLKRFLELIKAS